MTNDNERPDDQTSASEPAPATPSQAPQAVGPSPAPGPEPQLVVSQPVAAATAQRHWSPARAVLVGGSAVVAGVLLFGSGFAIGHAVGGDDHGGRPMALRDAGPRGPRDGSEQEPLRQMPQRPDGEGPRLQPRGPSQRR